MEKIKTAIVGLGRIASLLEEDTLREKPCTHVGAITANDECLLAAGCDLDEKRRTLFAEKWKVPVFADAAEMLNIHKPQILVIATHPDSHYYYCRLGAQKNIPVIICEKPLADNIREAKKIVDLTEGGKPIIITNHERRYSGDYILTKDILDKEKLGKLLGVRACLYMGVNRRLIDQFWHDGTHLIDVIMYLTNSILKHRRSLGAKMTANTGTTWLEGELKNKNCGVINSIPVFIEIGSGRDHLVFEIEFSCEKGRLRIGNGVFEVWQSVPSSYAENFRSLEKTDEVFKGATGYFSNMLKDAVACVKDPQRKPISGVIDGLRVIEYLNNVMKWRKKT
jgi:predicted dehydrogenase